MIFLYFPAVTAEIRPGQRDEWGRGPSERQSATTCIDMQHCASLLLPRLVLLSVVLVAVFLARVAESFLPTAAVVGSITTTVQPSPSGHSCSSMIFRLSPLSCPCSLYRSLHTASAFTSTTPYNSVNLGRGYSRSRTQRLRASQSPISQTGLPRATTVAVGSRTRAPESTSSEDTIFALSTGNSGPAGVAVIRISGPRAANVLEMISAAPAAREKREGNVAVPQKGAVLPAPRRAVVRRLFDPTTGELLDEAMVLWMPGPRSFTGEDTVELHTHGSRAVINGVLDALGSMASVRVRMAERGEFTQRAYDNGRMDLTGVEGLADLLAADTAAQRKQALKQMSGALRDMYESWREELKGCLAHTEAVIDFGDDEEDVGGDAAFAALLPRVSNLASEIETHLRDGRRGEIVRSGVKVAIIGPPNAGKSSLLNLLAARPAAIVSPVAGTTRDIVEVQMDIAGLPVTLSDTAGLREATDDEVEKEGMRRARGAVDNAHLAIFVVDSTDAAGAAELLRQLRQEARDAAAEESDEAHQLATRDDELASALDDVIVVANKADLGDASEQTGEEDLLALVGAESVGEGGVGGPVQVSGAVMEGEGTTEWAGEGDAKEQRSRVWRISCKSKEGIDSFVSHLEAKVVQRFQAVGDDESPLITRRRHRQHVEACLEALRASQEMSLPLDLAAEELRIASYELGCITGAVGVEEILDVIFRDFCIGK